MGPHPVLWRIDPAQPGHLIGINAPAFARCDDPRVKRKTPMPTNEIAFLVLAVSALMLFGGVLGWASWMESRAERHSK